MQESTEPSFVVDLLTTLRQQRFGARAWGAFFQRSWLLSCQTARTNPLLKQSWVRVTCLVGCLMLVLLGSNLWIAGGVDTLRLLPGLLFCVIWQQSDLFWHLGLNRSIHAGTLLPRLGLANTLTWLRGLGASYLLGRVFGGLAVPSGLALAIFLVGIATDILDGQIARRTATQSKLGQIADAEADFCLSLALTIILLQNGVLPLWVASVMLLRFILPLSAALLSYLVLAHPVKFGSTWWGKAAGLAQCLYLLALLAPPLPFAFLPLLREILLPIMIGLFVLAPLAQIIINRQVQRETPNVHL